MERYNNFRKARVNDRRNFITLRRDIHFLFDEGDYVYAPKDGTMRLHFITANTTYFQYHNSPFSTEHVHIKFLYARFAWGIFKNLSPVDIGRDDGADGGDLGALQGLHSPETSHKSRKKRRHTSQNNSRQLKLKKRKNSLSEDDVYSDNKPVFPFFSRSLVLSHIE